MKVTNIKTTKSPTGAKLIVNGTYFNMLMQCEENCVMELELSVTMAEVLGQSLATGIDYANYQFATCLDVSRVEPRIPQVPPYIRIVLGYDGPFPTGIRQVDLQEDEIRSLYKKIKALLWGS